MPRRESSPATAPRWRFSPGGEKGLEAAANEIEQAGGRALVLPVDVANHGQVEAAASSVEDHFDSVAFARASEILSAKASMTAAPSEFRQSAYDFAGGGSPTPAWLFGACSRSPRRGPERVWSR